MYGYLYNDVQEIKIPDNIIQYDPDLVIWPIPPNPQTSFSKGLASVTNISRKPRYSITKAAMMESMGVERQPQLQMQVWTDVAESSFSQPDYYKDHIVTEHVPRFFIPTLAWDTDAENQRLWLQLLTYEAIDLALQVSLFPSVIPFILATGSAILEITSVSKILANQQATGFSQEEIINTSDNESKIQAQGDIQPLIDAKGNLLS